jgi:hypothetical protein
MRHMQTQRDHILLLCKAKHKTQNATLARYVNPHCPRTKNAQTLYGKLKSRIEAAEAASEEMAVQAWINHFDTDWRAPKEFLARRHSQRWGNQPTEIQLSSEKALPVTFLMDTPQIEPNIKLLDENEAS